MKKYRISESFLLISIAFFVCTTFFSLAFDKTKLHLTINSYHHPFADYFFKYITHLGDGLIFVPVIIYFIYHKDIKKALFFSLLQSLHC